MRFLVAFAAFVAVVLLSGCVEVSYIGDIYEPTTHVRFYMSEADVPRDTYRVMGTAVAAIEDDFQSPSELAGALRDKAKEVGADAIVITSQERYRVGTRYESDTDVFYTERERGKKRSRHDSHNRKKERYKSTTYGHSSQFTTGSEHAIHREEVRANFLKRKDSKDLLCD